MYCKHDYTFDWHKYLLNQVYGMNKFFNDILITFNILTKNKKYQSGKDTYHCKMCPDEIKIALK